MIPILYTPLETQFTSNGIGRLTDCISCTVTEERNGIFECEFQYPITGKFYNYLISNPCYIGVIHDDNHDVQPFELYRHSDPIDGIVTFNAHHISYNLANVIVNGIDADTCADAFTQFTSHNITACPFTFWTDKATSGDFIVDTPDNIRALLSGQEGSILDVYGSGEYEFDKYAVKLYANRGQDRGVTIRYGKNLTDITRTYDESGIFNAVVPYWTDSEGNIVALSTYVANTTAAYNYPWEDSINGNVMQDGNGNDIEFAHYVLKAVPLDLSDKFETAPTEDELKTVAQTYLANNTPWIPKDNIEVDFVQLWETPEYENVAVLQRVSLCDTVGIYYPAMGIATSAKVIKIVYNVLTEQYDKMELGEARATLADTIRGDLQDQIYAVEEESRSFTEEAVAKATEMITGGLGGYVVMTLNADGQPQEILIMDTDDVGTAVNVIRMNQNGIGFSTTGYNGPFTSAWTIDGAFNADFITTGTMLANRIYGGTLTVGGLNNQNGVFVVNDASGTEVGRWSNAGISLKKGIINLDTSGYIRCPISADGSSYVLFDNQGFQIYEEEDENNYDLISTTHHYIDDSTVLGLAGAHVENGTTWTFSISEDGIEAQQGIKTVRLDFDYGMLLTDGSHNLNYSFSTNLLNSNGGYIFSGTKSREVSTKEYNKRLLYCYETPTPMFGDIGEGVIDETGYCYIFLDPIFAETISTNQYQVFLQKYGDGDCWIVERKGGYFVVQGTVGLSFGWELKAKQKGYDQLRLEINQELTNPSGTDYGAEAAQYLKELEEGRQAA